MYATPPLKRLTKLFLLLVLTAIVTTTTAFAQATGGSGGSGGTGGSGGSGGSGALKNEDANPGTAWDIRKNYFKRFKFAKEFGPSEAGGADVIKDGESQGPGQITPNSGPVFMWPKKIIQGQPSQVPTKRDEAIMKFQVKTFGYPISDTQFQVIQRLDDNMMLEEAFDPERWMWMENAMGAIKATSAANSMANLARNQATSAIQFSQKFLENFTVQEGNEWNRMRNELFVPMAVLLLLPGAVLAQVRAIIAQGSPILGEVNPFDGILRSILAIFFIPATYLVVNYGIDVSNSIAHEISEGYSRINGGNMYQDAQKAQERAMDIRKQDENKNGIPADDTPNVPTDGADAVKQIEELAFDVSQGSDEVDPILKSTNRLLVNGANAGLTATWNVLCAFQMAYLYYLFCMGPIVAALWVWPMQQLRGALPSWVEGVVTLCFWSLFWNTSIMLMAAFKDSGQTGTIIMTALNFLTTASVKHAFDFAGLIKAAGDEVAKGAKSGGGGGGAQGGGGKQGGGATQGGQTSHGAPGSSGGHPGGSSDSAVKGGSSDSAAHVPTSSGGLAATLAAPSASSAAKGLGLGNVLSGTGDGGQGQHAGPGGGGDHPGGMPADAGFPGISDPGVPSAPPISSDSGPSGSGPASDSASGPPLVGPRPTRGFSMPSLGGMDFSSTGNLMPGDSLTGGQSGPSSSDGGAVQGFGADAPGVSGPVGGVDVGTGPVAGVDGPAGVTSTPGGLTGDAGYSPASAPPGAAPAGVYSGDPGPAAAGPASGPVPGLLGDATAPGGMPMSSPGAEAINASTGVPMSGDYTGGSAPPAGILGDMTGAGGPPMGGALDAGHAIPGVGGPLDGAPGTGLPGMAGPMEGHGIPGVGAPPTGAPLDLGTPSIPGVPGVGPGAVGIPGDPSVPGSQQGYGAPPTVGGDYQQQSYTQPPTEYTNTAPQTSYDQTPPSADYSQYSQYSQPQQEYSQAPPQEYQQQPQAAAQQQYNDMPPAEPYAAPVNYGDVAPKYTPQTGYSDPGSYQAPPPVPEPQQPHAAPQQPQAPQEYYQQAPQAQDAYMPIIMPLEASHSAPHHEPAPEPVQPRHEEQTHYQQPQQQHAEHHADPYQAAPPPADMPVAAPPPPAPQQKRPTGEFKAPQSSLSAILGKAAAPRGGQPTPPPAKTEGKDQPPQEDQPKTMTGGLANYMRSAQGKRKRTYSRELEKAEMEELQRRAQENDWA